MPDSSENNVACRICMDPKDEYVSLFISDLSKKVMEIADVRVEKHDGLPENVCVQCEKDLEKCYEFRLKVQVADKKFRQNLKFSQVDIEECKIKEERYVIDDDSDNGDDKHSEIMDEENYDEPDVPQRINEETEVPVPDPLNHVVVIEEEEKKVEMSENPVSYDDSKAEEEKVDLQKMEEVSVNPLDSMKEETETEMMDIDGNQPDAFEPSSSVRRGGSSKPKRNLAEAPDETKVDFGMDSLQPDIALKDEVKETSHTPCSSTHLLMSDNNSKPSKKFKTKNKKLKQLATRLQRHCDSESFSDSMSQGANSITLENYISSGESDSQSSASSPKKHFFFAEKQFKKFDPFCPVCNVSYESNDLLNEHRSKKGFICRVCATVFESHSDLEGHFTTHQSYNCKVCDEMFFCKIDLYQHKKTSEMCKKQVLYECEMCNKKFSRERNLRCHKTVYHSDSVDNFECIVCRKTFKTSFLLTNHLRHSHVVHEYIECSICHTLCLGPERLKTHFKSHNEESQYPCPDCGEVFNKKSLLRSHMPSHDFSINLCEICGESIRGKVAMKNHIDYKHQTGTFFCNLCNMQFDTKRKMVIHRKSHNRRYLPKPSICEICGKEFTSTQVLKNHLRIHFDERPFICDICGATFKQKVSLRNHHRTHSDVGQYCCISCGKTFKWKQTFDKHIRSCKFKFENIPGSMSE